MKKIAVSIIVPVYNVEKYLEKCLKSLVNQELKNIEIIIVNDGSPDNSEEIINKFCKKYNKIVFSYKKKNGGLSSARNYGIEKANGEYIAFVDSDDYVDETMFKKMYNKAKENDFDIVTCDVNYIYDDPKKNFICYSRVGKDLKNAEEVKKQMLDIYPIACNKIYKKELFEELRFKEGIWFEDVEFLYRLFPKIQSIGVLKDALYNYLQREGAITSSVDKRIYNYIDNWNGIIEYYKKNNIYEEFKGILEYCYIRYVYGTFIKTATKYKKEDYNNAVDRAINSVSKQFPDYRKNRYFYKNKKGIYLLMFNKFISKIVYILYNMRSKL